MSELWSRCESILAIHNIGHVADLTSVALVQPSPRVVGGGGSSLNNLNNNNGSRHLHQDEAQNVVDKCLSSSDVMGNTSSGSGSTSATLEPPAPLSPGTGRRDTQPGETFGSSNDNDKGSQNHFPEPAARTPKSSKKNKNCADPSMSATLPPEETIACSVRSDEGHANSINADKSALLPTTGAKGDDDDMSPKPAATSDEDHITETSDANNYNGHQSALAYNGSIVAAGSTTYASLGNMMTVDTAQSLLRQLGRLLSDFGQMVEIQRQQHPQNQSSQPPSPRNHQQPQSSRPSFALQDSPGAISLSGEHSVSISFAAGTPSHANHNGGGGSTAHHFARQSTAAHLGSFSSFVAQPQATTRYHRGSISNLLVSTGSIYCQRPDVVETGHVVVGRDDDDNKTLNDYVIIGELGRGSFGKVKLAEHQHTRELFAVKIVKLALLTNNAKAQRNHALSGNRNGSQQESKLDKLMREVAVMKKVAHKNLVRLHEVMHDSEKNKLYLVMDYIESGTVTVKTSPTTVAPLEMQVARGYAKQIAAGLRALHRNGIFHRDVKPDNLLLGSNGNVYVADFGVSVICAEDGVEGVEGTPAFMAPELCRGELRVQGEAVDTWALGVTLYQMVIGSLPFTGETHLNLTRRIVNDEVVFPEALANGSPVPEDFKVAIRGLLEKNSSQRWSLMQFLNSSWCRGSSTSSSPHLHHQQQHPSSLIPEALLQSEDRSDDCASPPPPDAATPAAKHVPTPKQSFSRSVVGPLSAADLGQSASSSSMANINEEEDAPRQVLSEQELQSAFSPMVSRLTSIAVAKRVGGLARKLLDQRESSIASRTLRSGVFEMHGIIGGALSHSSGMFGVSSPSSSAGGVSSLMPKPPAAASPGGVVIRRGMLNAATPCQS